jgi:hypothetical protein
MRTLVIATTVAALLALGGVSEAAQISSPMIFGTGEQDRAECVVLNTGSSPVALTVKLINDFGGTEATYNCGGPLGPGQFCSLLRPIDNASAYACTATAGSTGNLRGTAVLLERVLDSWDLFRLRAVRSAPMR